MHEERGNQILNAGMEAAQVQLSRRLRKVEYPRDYDTLYAWLEDKLFTLYESIRLRKIQRTHDTAGEIIITASEIAEFAKTEIGFEKITKGVESDEVLNNQH